MRNCLPGRRHRMVKDTSQESVPKLHLGNGQKTTQPHCREARHSRGRSQQRKQFTMPWEHLIALWMSGNRVWSYPMHLQRSVCISTWITDHRQPHPRGNYSSTDVSRSTSCPWTYSNASLILKKKKVDGQWKTVFPTSVFFFFFHRIGNKKQRSEGESHCALGTCHIATAGMLLQLRPQTTTRDTRTSSFCCGTLRSSKPALWQVSEIEDLEQTLGLSFFFSSCNVL